LNLVPPPALVASPVFLVSPGSNRTRPPLPCALISCSLWCGFVVLGSRERFYFAGDTAYCPIFGQIGERFGPFDLGE
ncbi:unnamed protein product, partial [Hapterophycus canaliculatus]